MSQFAAAIVPSSILGLSYVLSLYIWRSNEDRNHPSTIKRRFISAFIMTLVAPIFVYYFGSPKLLEVHGLWTTIGIRWQCLFEAAIVPVLLTMTLFLGPLASLASDERVKMYTVPAYWTYSFQNWIWWRNHVVAPFTEEFTFRACMLPILLRYFTPFRAVLISPVFFGFAHFHHMVERVKRGQDLKSAFLYSSFQFAYTTVFGIYSAYLFVRTGHLAAPVCVHGFCNFMGFPDLVELYNQPPKKRLVLSGFFVMGVIIFYLLLEPLTIPAIYQNRAYTW